MSSRYGKWDEESRRPGAARGRPLVAGLLAVAVTVTAFAPAVAAPNRPRRRTQVIGASPAANASDVAPESLVVRFHLSKPVGPETKLDRAAKAWVNGERVEVETRLALDGSALDVHFGTTPPHDAEVRVKLRRFAKDARGKRMIVKRPRYARPLVFRTARASEGPTDPGPSPDDPAGVRGFSSAVLLDGGEILVSGGLDGAGIPRGDLEKGSGVTFEPLLPRLASARWAHGGVRLPDGRVLLVGGFTDGAGAVPTNQVDIFDPTTESLDSGTPLLVARGAPRLVRTVNGVVVALGGSAAFGGGPASAAIEAWEPFTNTFVPLDEELPAPRHQAAVARLASGGLLVAGGADDQGAVLSDAQLVDPLESGDDVVEPAGPLNVARRAACAAPMASGRVLVAGGVDEQGARLDSVEVFDPESGTFSTLAVALSEARSHARTVILANGAIAVVGGVTDEDGTASRAIDVFDPLTGEILTSTTANRDLVGAPVLALADGSLWIGGGVTSWDRPPVGSGRGSVLRGSALGGDPARPAVLAVTPAPAATGVDPDAVIRVTFSRPLDPASLADGLTVVDGEGRAVAGTITLGGVNEMVFTPTRPLPPNQTIAASVATSVADPLGSTVVDDGTRHTSFSTAFDATFGAADEGSQFGYSARSGDVNGDGIDDLIVSAYVAESVPGSGNKEGQVYVVFGGGAATGGGAAGRPLFRDLSSLAGGADLTVTAESAGDQPGIESALDVVDFDGDGTDDIVIGAHFADGIGDAESSRGEVWVVFGRSSFGAASLRLGTSVPTGFDVLRVYGETAGTKFGEGISHGDVDGDGTMDLVVGATGVDVDASNRDQGAIYVLFGASKASLGLTNGFASDQVGPGATALANVRLLGADNSDRLGWSTACGDFDGDGYADPVGGATGADGVANGASSTGEAVGFFGAARSTLIPTGLHTTWRAGTAGAPAGFVVHGEDRSDFFGWSMLAGDLNGDGYDDLAVGATLADGATNGNSTSGEAVVLFGGARSRWAPDGGLGRHRIGPTLAGPGLLRVFGEDGGDAFGDTFAIDDVDGDGNNDLIVGAYGGDGIRNAVGSSTGELTVLRGSGLVPGPSGVPVQFSVSADPANLPSDVTVTRFYGREASDRFGTTVAVGDWDDDGNPDLFTGANRARGLGRLFRNAGEAYLFWGRPTWWR